MKLPITITLPPGWIFPAGYTTCREQLLIRLLAKSFQMPHQRVIGIVHQLLQIHQDRIILYHQAGGENGESFDHKGAVYRIWKMAKAPIRGDSSKAILETCDLENNAMRQAYEAALSTGIPMDNLLNRQLNMQLLKVRNTEIKIREYHDAL